MATSKKATAKKEPAKKTVSKKTTPKKATAPKKATKPTKATTKKTASNGPKQNAVKKGEFRTNKKTGHPSYIYVKVGSRYKYIGITHAEITDGVKNIKLDKNPNPNDSRVSYARPTPAEDKTKNFKEKKAGWELSSSDKKKVRKIIKNSKK